MKFIGIAKNIGCNVQGSTLICFPDYLETQHLSEVNNIKQVFNDPSFTLNLTLIPFKPVEFYSFTHTVDLELNSVLSVIKNIFSSQKQFLQASHNLAKLLYEYSTHPKVKGGELNVAYFKNIVLDDEFIDAIGIFKSESDVPFIKMKNQKTKYNIIHDHGFEINGMDKGCLIFNVNVDKGYKILVIDNINKSNEAQYWKGNFLKIEPLKDSFHSYAR